jgi:hypothetical protein
VGTLNFFVSLDDVFLCVLNSLIESYVLLIGLLRDKVRLRPATHALVELLRYLLGHLLGHLRLHRLLELLLHWLVLHRLLWLLRLLILGHFRLVLRHLRLLVLGHIWLVLRYLGWWHNGRYVVLRLLGRDLILSFLGLIWVATWGLDARLHRLKNLVGLEQ